MVQQADGFLEVASLLWQARSCFQPSFENLGFTVLRSFPFSVFGEGFEFFFVGFLLFLYFLFIFNG